MLGKATLACLIGALFGTNAVAAQDVTAVVDRDLRLFVVSAALNVAGFDVELAPRYHPVRERLRESLGDVNEDLASRLRAFYEEHRGDATDEEQLAAYVSLALGVSDPPGMTALYSEALTPPDARALSGFIPLAMELYREANLLQLWSRFSPEYEAGLDRLVPPIRESLLQSEAYLRLPSVSSPGRREVILLELTLPVNSVNIRNYPDNMYIVLGDPGSVTTDVVRHGYLHLHLDPLLAALREELRPTSGLLALIEDVAGIRPNYAEDAETMVGESLIRAAELRMDRNSDASQDGEIDQAYREGLLLTPYFYEQLQEFENGDRGIRQYLPDVISDLDIEAEQARFDDRFFAIAFSEAEPVRANVPELRVDPARSVLEEAQKAFNSGDDQGARELFMTVLTDLEPGNGPALYGMALLASREQNPELARQYFNQTISSTSAEEAMVAWSHVYLGRIDDIVCDRETALEHYRSALEIIDEASGPGSAALRGIETPFGGAAC